MSQYWNEVLSPDTPLDPDTVKALIASESSFDANAGRGKRSTAKGLMQLLPTTIRYLNGNREELDDHILEFQDTESLDPSVNICAGVRWLFRKRETASARLKRTANWDESVEEYKDYLRRRLKNPKGNFKGMNTFREHLTNLRSGSN
jgi:hypothetical protein